MSVEALKTLTEPEATVFYWVCKGLIYEKIGEKMGYSIEWVTLRMSGVYQKLGFEKKTHWQARRKLLREVYCPAFMKLINNDAANLKNFPLVVEGETEESGEGIKEPVQKALIPIEDIRAMVLADEQQALEDDERRRQEYQRAQTPILIPRQPRSREPEGRQRRLWWGIGGSIAAVVICSVVCIAGGALGWYLYNRPSQPVQANSPLPPPIANPSTRTPQIPPASTTVPPTVPPTLAPTEQPTIVLTATPKAYYEEGEWAEIRPGVFTSIRSNFMQEGFAMCSHPTPGFGVFVDIKTENDNGFLLRYDPSAFHAQDDLGNEYRLAGAGWGYCDEGPGPVEHQVQSYNPVVLSITFSGQVPLEAKYLIITADSLSGTKVVFRKLY